MKDFVDGSVQRSMRLRVQHENGKVEVLTLIGRWTTIEGGSLNRLRSDIGFEHFFTKDGFYDGWGAGLEQSESGSQPEEILNALEQKREFPSD
jgi:hypothetical protein